MSTRWMAVQYIGDILRIPVANESDMDTPFGSSTLERDVRRIVVNPFSDGPQVFVPEAENAKLRELAILQSVIFKHMSTCPTTDCQVCPVKEECAESVHLEGLLGIDDKETSWLVQWRSEDAADVQAENAKLRTQLADVTESMGRAEGRCAKLRELVRDMHAVISDRNSWWDCMCKDTRRFADRMRELGIEAEQ